MVGLVAISQLRLTCPGPLDRGVARATSRNPAQQFEGRRLSVPRAVDRSRLIGWSSLRQERRQSLRSFVAVAGTPARFQNRWELGRVAKPFGRAAPAVNLRSRAPPSPRVLRRSERTNRTPSVVSRWARDESRATRPMSALVGEGRSPSPYRLRRGVRAASVVRRLAETSLASAQPSIRLAAPRAAERAVRRTDFCHLTCAYEHPRLGGSRCASGA